MKAEEFKFSGCKLCRWVSGSRHFEGS